MSNTGSKYRKIIVGVDKKESAIVDIYSVIRAFCITDPALQHGIKKIAMPGLRGKGTEADDLIEATDCILEAAHEAVKMAGTKPVKNLQRFRVLLSAGWMHDLLADLRQKLYSEGSATHAAKIEDIDAILGFLDLDD